MMCVRFVGNLDSRLKDKADTGTAVGRGVLDPAGNIRYPYQSCKTLSFYC